MSPNTKYKLSQYKNPGAPFLDYSTKRFKTDLGVIPGPGDYKAIDSICDSGHYNVSKNRGYGKRIFTG